MSLHSFTRKLGQWSNKHDLDGECDIILEISSSVTGLNAENIGGSAGGQKVDRWKQNYCEDLVIEK